MNFLAYWEILDATLEEAGLPGAGYEDASTFFNTGVTIAAALLKLS